MYESPWNILKSDDITLNMEIRNIHLLPIMCKWLSFLTDHLFVYKGNILKDASPYP